MLSPWAAYLLNISNRGKNKYKGASFAQKILNFVPMWPMYLISTEDEK
jgi:hypothetical protein